MKKALASACAVALLALLAVGPVRADDADTVEYRQHIMRTLEEEMSAIGMILAQRAPAGALAAHERVLAITAGTARKAFESNTPGGKARPEVWAHGADFARHLEALERATGRLAQADAVSATAARDEVATACKGCHDQYRLP